MHRQRRKGFTLVEILISIAIFAIGGVSILALFIAAQSGQDKAMDLERAREVAEQVRGAIEASLALPPVELPDGRRLYQLSIPFASLRNESRRYGTNVDRTDIAESAERIKHSPVWFYELPTEPWRGPEQSKNTDRAFERLPLELQDIDGNELNGSVFYIRPTELTLRQKPTEASRLDKDESDLYSFEFVIRRSIARSEFRSAANVNDLLEGLYVIQLRVYKAFDPDRTNQPIQEFEFTVNGF